jgi:hypothetical protein
VTTSGDWVFSSGCAPTENTAQQNMLAIISPSPVRDAAVNATPWPPTR